MSVIEVKPQSGIDNQNQINMILAAASPGQRVALVGLFPISLVPIAANRSYFGGIHIPNGRWLDISEATIILAANQKRMVKPGTTEATTQFAALITNADLSNGRDIRVTGGPSSMVDGNALNQVQNDCRFNGIQFRNTSGVKLEDLKVKNIRGIDGMGGPTESFVYDFVGGGGSRVVRDCIAFADEAHKPETSTGFSVNAGADFVLFDHCEAYGLKDHGFTSWKCSDGIRSFCRGHHNGSTGGRWEYGARNRDIGCSYDNNDGTGLVLQGSLDHVVDAYSLLGNKDASFRAVSGATYKFGLGAGF